METLIGVVIISVVMYLTGAECPALPPFAEVNHEASADVEPEFPEDCSSCRGP